MYYFIIHIIIKEVIKMVIIKVGKNELYKTINEAVSHVKGETTLLLMDDYYFFSLLKMEFYFFLGFQILP